MGNAVDPTGLSFTVTKKDGTTASVSPQTLTPTTWGDTAGTQTCTFTYSDGYDSVSCEVEATVLAEELTSITLGGTEAMPIRHGELSTVGQTVTAHYNSGRTADVTSSANCEAATEHSTSTTSNWGPGVYWNASGSEWYIESGKYHWSYTEDGITKTADTSYQPIGSDLLPNTAQTAYELVNEASLDGWLSLMVNEPGNVTGPIVGLTEQYEPDGGFYGDGASEGDLIWTVFSKDQYDASDTGVDFSGFLGVVGAISPVLEEESTTGPSWGQFTIGSGDDEVFWILSNHVTGLATVAEPVHLVSVVGHLKSGVTIPGAGAGSIKPSDFADGAKVYYVDVVPPVTP